MASIRSQYQNKSWWRDRYLISTDSSMIPIAKLNDFFATSDMHWAKPLPEDVMAETLDNSLCFGLYEDKSANRTLADRECIGFARCITDFTTFLYLTDVYTIPRVRGAGLGKWLVTCIREVMDSMPYVRRIMFITGDWERSVPFYEKVLGASVVESRPPQLEEENVGLAVLSKTGPGWPEH